MSSNKLSIHSRSQELRREWTPEWSIKTARNQAGYKLGFIAHNIVDKECLPIAATHGSLYNTNGQQLHMLRWAYMGQLWGSIAFDESGRSEFLSNSTSNKDDSRAVAESNAWCLAAKADFWREPNTVRCNSQFNLPTSKYVSIKCKPSYPDTMQVEYNAAMAATMRKTEWKYPEKTKIPNLKRISVEFRNNFFLAAARQSVKWK